MQAVSWPLMNIGCDMSDPKERVVGLLRIVCFVLATGGLAGAQLCPQWSEGRVIGQLDERILFEASGLAASHDYPPRLYHINDSGNPSGFVISDGAGDHEQFVMIEWPELVDPEDLAVGPCEEDGAGHCLIVGDIGDNASRRPEVSVLVIREQEEFDSPVHPDRRLRLRYPDGAHDAESLAADPRSGDLYILVKEFALFPSMGRSAKLFRLPAAKWRNAGADEVLLLEPYGEFDLPAMAAQRKARLSHVATSMDISPDGRRLLVLSYDHAWEINWDLSEGPPPAMDQLDYQFIPLTLVLGKETITWLPDGGGFIHGKEFKPDKKPSVLVRFDCLEPAE